MTRATLATTLSIPLGVTAFAYPFFLPSITATNDAGAHAADAPLLLLLIGLLCLLALSDRRLGLGSTPPRNIRSSRPAAPSSTHQPAARPARTSTPDDHRGHSAPTPTGTTKLIALLGVLVALNSALRLLPALAGASPIFVLILLVGYAYRATFGFLMGVLTLVVSALITGGVGPWLPYQMLAAGWLGLTAGWLPDLRQYPRREGALLAIFGFLWGLLYGAILNLWFWPFIDPATSALGNDGLWHPGLLPAQTIGRYLTFYLVTSLVYDLFRAVATAALTLALARPLLFVLRRFERRFSWQPYELSTERPGESNQPGR